jgi:polyisoprenoid-binding protein YceI
MSTKNILRISIIILCVILVAFLYVTRPVSAPIRDVEKEKDSLATDSKSEKVFSIVPEKSLIKFSINEVLRGSPFEVIGTSTVISGDVKINMTPNQSSISIGTLKINAKTFVTDDARRDGAIVRLILKSDTPQNEFIEFTPKEISGVPNSILENEEFNFTVNGDLLISGVTKPATFISKATIKDGVLTGVAEAEIKRSDYNLIIPNFPFIANVDDVFKITVNLVAE